MIGKRRWRLTAVKDFHGRERGQGAGGGVLVRMVEGGKASMRTRSTDQAASGRMQATHGDRQLYSTLDWGKEGCWWQMAGTEVRAGHSRKCDVVIEVLWWRALQSS